METLGSADLGLKNAVQETPRPQLHLCGFDKVSKYLRNKFSHFFACCNSLLDKITLEKHKIDNSNRMLTFLCTIQGPARSDYNTRLFISYVIQLSGGHLSLNLTLTRFANGLGDLVCCYF